MKRKSGGNPRKSVSVAQRKAGKVIDSIPSDHEVFGYTCFLIPRISSLKLTRDLAKISSVELKQICLSNGWTLEFVNVNAKYLQWAVSAAQPVTVMDMISHVRSGLNEQIQPVFKKRKHKPSLDFWADGYLTLRGLHPHPGEIIDQYILFIRRHQQKQ